MNSFYKKNLVFIVLLGVLYLSQTGYGQNATLSGVVTDSLKNPLSGGNLLFFPENKTLDILFSITNPQGKYTINLKKGEKYIAEISYLGYGTYRDSIRLQEDTVKNIVLTTSSQNLDEIILTERLPVKIGQDSIIYRPEKFLTGEERKLRDVLKKLPGLEVDRDGNVKVKGKDVDELLVDGEKFFTGDEKLGVNNIPVGVIDEIEALDNYTDIAFLRGLTDSDKLVLNIKLKKGKKKFAFGDIEAGGGIEDRYTINPTVFYYSPNTNINAIGDFNNVGEKSFTFKDYLDFENRDFGENNARPFDSGFSRFLLDQNFTFNRTNFGAFSINQKISPRLKLNAFSILSDNNIKSRQVNNITYLSNNNLDEERITEQERDLGFTLSKAELRYIGKEKLDVKYELFVKTNNADALSELSSFTAQENTFSNQDVASTLASFSQNLSINKGHNLKHTSSLNIYHTYTDSQNNILWDFNRPIFSTILPIEETGDAISLLQLQKQKGHDLNTNYKHYWVLHRYHHIYPEIGFNYSEKFYDTNDAQLINGTSNNFFDAGFTNDLDYLFRDSYVGLTYKAKTGKFIFQPKLVYHNYDWTINQLNTDIRNTSKGVLLPEAKIKFKVDYRQDIELDYRLNARFGQARQLANRLRLSAFNQISVGNENLENELFHTLNLSYDYSDLNNGLFIKSLYDYTKTTTSIRNTTEIANSIDQINTLFLSDLPESTHSILVSFDKLVKKYKFSFKTRAIRSDYSRIINETTQDFSSQLYSYDIDLGTKYKNAPNIKIGWDHTFNTFTSETTTTNFTQINPSINLNYRFFKDFVFDANYNFNYYENRSVNEINRFSIGDASLVYAQEDSPWIFTIDIDNIFDTRFRNQNSLSQFLISDTQTFIQERTILFKAGYRF